MTSPKVCLDLEVTSGANIFCLVSITDPPAGKLAREKVGGGGSMNAESRQKCPNAVYQRV